MKEQFLGVDVCGENYDELASLLLKDIDEGRKSFIVAINPEKVMKAKEDPSLKDLLNTATYQIPDGIGIILASRLKGGKIRERVTGIDMMLNVCKMAAGNGKSVFLYGAKPGIAAEAADKLKEMYPGLTIAGVMDGYEKDEQKVMDTINHANPDIIFVAMGSPRQENWIIQHMDSLAPSVYQGVGGSFDVISGKIQRAPDAFQKLGMEWFYRLMKEPWRWKRQLLLPKFLLAVMGDKKR
jgi:N-acetylglucosaminyldiphosphoundecaprenol N-acetyl-beta-D-mannosaminyltransferase